MAAAAQDFWLEELAEARHFNSWVADLIAPAIAGDVLEIGCGTGNFTGLLARRARSVMAVDLNPEYVKAAQQRWRGDPRIGFRCCDATTESWTSKFDTVVLLDVLEHVQNDVWFLRSLRKALRPAGTLIVKAPSGHWLYGTLDQAIGHYRRYSKRTLRFALQRAGCDATASFYFNRLGVLGWWLNGRVLQHKTPPAAQVKSIEMLVPMLRRVERLAPLPFGLSLIAISRAVGEQIA
jgi:SAM-dependent methyltransferase